MFRRLLLVLSHRNRTSKMYAQAKEVSKSNFAQEGQMEKQRWEESEKSREEARRSEKRKGQKKDDAGGEKVEKSRSTVCGQ